MKKTIVLFLLFVSLTCTTAFSQTGSINPKQPTVSVHFTLNDYRTPQLIKNTSVSQVLRTDSWSSFKEMSPGLSVAYHKGLSDHVDFMASLGGAYVKYQLRNGKQVSSERILIEADVNLNMKLLPDNFPVNPYVTAGVGASLYGVHYGAYIPLGLGLQFKLGEDAFLFSNFQYRTGITEFTNNHMNLSVGFGAPIGSKKGG
jgi:hypothetical protein